MDSSGRTAERFEEGYALAGRWLARTRTARTTRCHAQRHSARSQIPARSIVLM